MKKKEKFRSLKESQKKAEKQLLRLDSYMYTQDTPVDEEYDESTPNKNSRFVILSINRIITLWQEDINESTFHIRHHENNIQALKNSISVLAARLGNGSYFMKQVADINAKINHHRAEIDRHTDFITQTNQDIINLAQVVNVFKHSPRAMKNIYNRGERFVSTQESIDRAIDMLHDRINDTNNAQIAEYLRCQKDGSQFVGKNHFVINIYNQDIENLKSLCYDTQKTR